LIKLKKKKHFLKIFLPSKPQTGGVHFFCLYIQLSEI